MKEKFGRNLGILLSVWILVIHTILFFFFRESPELWYGQLFRFAFLPVQLLFTSVLVYNYIRIKELRQKRKNMSLQLNLFFTEIGNGILVFLKKIDNNIEEIESILQGTRKHDDNFFDRVEMKIMRYQSEINIQSIYSTELLNFLLDKIELIHNFMTNPLLIENESFGNLLWTIYRFLEEYKFNIDSGYQDNKKTTYTFDMLKKIEDQLLREWIKYLIDLKTFYPDRFSYAILNSPFDFMRKKILNSSKKQINKKG